ACPTGVLRPSHSGLTIGQPELDFGSGACNPDCDRQCAKACPVGAIAPLDGVLRRDVHVGRAVWHADRCLRSTEGVSCSLCVRKCPVGAIHIAGGVPVVDEVACIGCGECERHCAARPEPALVVEGDDVQRVVRPMSEDDLASEMKRLLREEGFAVATARGGVIARREKGRGIKPLLDLLDAGALRGALVVDRVIGRAAAAICIVGGARKVAAVLASADAAKMLERHGIPFSADETVPHILNREKTGGCPMEATVEGLDDPAAMVSALRARVAG
ncbi:MAG: DUF1893 domain-containing protein, partial [Kiritimatiellae bacterium]|nr:DUF1893 domain-containing protein [Kiritimatiellia bacterium]